MISINISDLIWTIINFLLFCFLLNHFLFKPVLRFMDDRQARVDATEKEKSRDEAKRILSKADSDSAEQHAALMLQAREDAAQDRKDAEADLEARREKTAETLSEATPELADLLARHLLGEE